MTARNTPVITLVPDKYDDLLPFFEALQQLIQEQGDAVADLATDADLPTAVTKVNELLGVLRDEGTIKT